MLVKPEVKEAFIELAMMLEPERLYQDGERTQEEVDAAFKEINILWNHLEKVHQVNVTQDEAERWAWEQ